MENVKFGFEFEDKGYFEQLEKTIQLIDTLEKQTNTTSKSQQEAIEAVRAKSKELEQQFQDILTKATAYDRGMKEANKTTSRFTDRLISAAKNQKIFGVSINDVINKLRAKRKALQETKDGIDKTEKGMKKFNNTVSRNPIGLFIKVLSNLIGILSKTEQGMDLIDKVTSSVSAGMEVITRRVFGFGKSLFTLLKGNFSEGINGIKDSFAGVGTEIVNTIKLTNQLEEARTKLRDAQRDLKVEFSEQRAEIERLRSLADDETKSYRDRAKAAKDAIAIEDDLEAKRLKNAQENLRIIQDENAKIKQNKELNDDQKEAESEALIIISNIRAESERKRRADFRQLQNIRKESAAAAKKQQEDEQKRVKKLTGEYKKLVEEIEERQTQLELASLTGVELLQRQRQLALEELKQLEESTIEKANQINRSETEIQAIRDDFTKARLLTTQQFEKEINNFILEQQKKLLKDLESETDKFLSERDKKLNNRINFIKGQETAALKEVDLLKKSSSDILTLEQDKERKRLVIKLESLKKQKALLEEFNQGDSNQAQIFGIDIQLLQNQIDRLDNLDLSPFAKLKKTILESLGITEEEAGFIIEQLGTVFNSVSELITAGTNQQIAIQERLIERIEKRINDAESAVEKEKELAEKGFANNLNIKKKELEEIQKEKEKAENVRLKFEKKAARQRLIIESLQQTSSLVTAGANVIAAESRKGFLGVAFAIAAIGAFFKIFSNIKNQARQTAGDIKLNTGGRIPTTGRTDKGDNRGHRVEDTNIIVGAGEWVTNAETSAIQDEFFQSLNAGKYDKLPLKEMAEAALDSKNHLQRTIKNARETEKEIQVINIEQRSQLTQDAMKEAFKGTLKEEIDRLIKFQKEQPREISLGDGRYIEIKETDYGKTTRTVEVKK